MRARVAIQSLFVPNTHDSREITTRNKAMYSCAGLMRAKRFTGKTIDVIAQLTGAPLASPASSVNRCAVKRPASSVIGSSYGANKYTRTQKIN